MTYYVCKKCYYKHTFLPLECVKCGNTNFYPLITSEPTVKLSSCGGMTQEDVLKLRIENEQLKKQIEKMKCCENCKFKDCDKSNRYQTCWYCTNKDKWKLRR